MMRILTILFLSCLVALSQPAPVKRNAMSTNVAGTAVKSVNDLFVTNFSGAITHTQWNFFGIGPNTIARLTDVTGIVNTVSGSATNAISTIQSNGVVVSAMTTNLNFVDNPTAKVLMTNNPSGLIHLSFTNIIGATTADLIAASNFLYSIAGETNWLGDAGITNSIRIGLADGKVNNTNLVKTLQAGRGIILTNELGGTNVRIANSYFLSFLTNTVAAGSVVSVTPILDFIAASGLNVAFSVAEPIASITYSVDWLQVASQTNLNSVSNALIDWNGNAGITNATRIGLADGRANNTNLIKTLEAGFGVVLTNEVGGTNVRIALQPNIIGITIQTNLNTVFTPSTLANFTNGSGLLIRGSPTIGGSEIEHRVDWAQVASQTNLNAASNALFNANGISVRTNDVTVFNPSIVLSLSNGSGLLIFGATHPGGSGVAFQADWAQVASKTNIAFVTNDYIRLTPQSWLPNTNAPPGLDQGTNQTWRMLFDDTALERVNYQFMLPRNYYTNANLKVKYSTLAAAANSSNVWRLACMITKDDTATINADAYNGAVFFTNQVPSTAGFTRTFTMSCNLTSAVAGDFVKLLLQREGTNTFDNNSGDTAVHEMQFEYEVKVQ